MNLLFLLLLPTFPPALEPTEEEDEAAALEDEGVALEDGADADEEGPLG